MKDKVLKLISKMRYDLATDEDISQAILELIAKELPKEDHSKCETGWDEELQYGYNKAIKYTKHKLEVE